MIIITYAINFYKVVTKSSFVYRLVYHLRTTIIGFLTSIFWYICYNYFFKGNMLNLCMNIISWFKIFSFSISYTLTIGLGFFLLKNKSYVMYLSYFDNYVETSQVYFTSVIYEYCFSYVMYFYFSILWKFINKVIFFMLCLFRISFTVPFRYVYSKTWML